MSLITGDFKIVNPEKINNQIAIENIMFIQDQKILLWSSFDFYIYNTEGQILHRKNLDKTLSDLHKVDAKNLVCYKTIKKV